MVFLLVSEVSARGRAGWGLMVAVKGGEGGPVVNQGALPGAGTRKSGEGRVGTGPNDSSTALYKYSRAGSARLPLLLAAKNPRHNRVSPSLMELFDALFIVLDKGAFSTELIVVS